MRANKFIYVVKVKGRSKIPDYVQLRDENYTLLAYFRADRPEKGIQKAGLGDKLQEIIEIIEHIPFGKMHKINI